jgi:hypothetical protein
MVSTIASFVAVPSYANPGDEITFYANASSDNSSATLQFIIYYDSLLVTYQNNTNSPMSVNYTGTPGNVVTKFTYTAPGNFTGGGYSVLLVVKDGTSTASQRLFVIVTGNTAPYFAPSLPGMIPSSSNETLLLETVVYDLDDDPVEVTWDFGDGSPVIVDVTGPAGYGVPLSQTHAWIVEYEPGRGDYDVNYTLNVTALDSEGNSLSMVCVIDIYVNYNKEPTVSFFADSLYADPEDTVQLYANATDLEGDPITWTFVFNNSYENYSTVVEHTDASAPNTTVWMNLTHVFGAMGNYTVTLFVSDALIPWQIDYHNLSSSVSMSVVVNTMPYVTQTIQQSPGSAYFNETTGVCTVMLTIEASDLDGDIMTVAWDFGDGSDPGLNTSGSDKLVYKFYQLHTFTDPGLYNVSVLVTDGRAGHDVSRYGLVTIMSNNSRPIVVGFNRTLSNGSVGTPNSTSRFTLTIMDKEMDPIDILWDFGDGTPTQRMTVTEFDEEFLVRCTMEHVYVDVGNYTVTVWYTDHKFDTTYHNGTAFCTVTIEEVVIPVVRSWNWWDYTSLGLIFATIGVIIGRWVYIGHKRKVLDQRGLSLEEYRIIEKAQAPVDHGKNEKGG